MNPADQAPSAAALEQVCAHLGIQPHYHDVWGKPCRAPASTLLALAAAMREELRRPDDAPQVLASLQDEEWQRSLPAAIVLREGMAVHSVPLLLAAGHPSLAWRIVAENAERTQEINHTCGGDIEPADLVQTGSRWIGEREVVRYEWRPPAPAKTGYYKLCVVAREHPGEVLASTHLIACPSQCHRPPFVRDSQRLWGPAIQLYAVRSSRNWGMGDFTDLRSLVDVFADLGAGFIGLNPLHALDYHRPAEASPYSPSSRTALNALYTDVEAVADFAEYSIARERVLGEAFQQQLEKLRDPELVDYAGVADAKWPVLELLYRHFRERHLACDSARAQAFRAFQHSRGDVLRRHALFEALGEHFIQAHGGEPGSGAWPSWPDEYKDANSETVRRFCAEHMERVEYFEYLQWQADLQLSEAQRHAAERGMPLGLYQDLAVGSSANGSETWSRRDLFARGVSIGAPPDDFNLKGQDWGLPPLLPNHLPENGYASFVAMLRACMRHAGALRIDHVMGLMRLYWVPAGAGADEGAYVHYPFQDLLGLLALESERARCLVIGEDLGTVPDEVRRELLSLGVLSYRPLYFEKAEAGEFKSPSAFPREALAAVSTHDLPTLEGFWRGTDLAVRQALDLYPNDAMRERMILDRAADRARLVLALEREGLEAPGRSIEGAFASELPFGSVRAIHEFVSRAASHLMALQMEDVLGQVEQVNMPSTWGDAYPNWRRKLTLKLEAWKDDPRVTAIASALRKDRGWNAPQPRAGRSGAPCGHPIPRATYRVQFNRGFGFADAARQVPYLATLGISHLYASSYLKARAGSTHGYDVVDHNALNPEIGSEEDFEQLVIRLREHGMNQMLDLVPNHMGVLESDNAWWLDVLENGPASRYAGYFDIDWQPQSPELSGKVLLPVLGEPYGATLEAGQLKLEFDAARGEFRVSYYSHRFPLDPREYPAILPAAGDFAAPAGYADVLSGLAGLPARDRLEPEEVARRARDKETLKQKLAGLVRDHGSVARAIEQSVETLNGLAGDASSFDALHRLIENQAFRLAHWRVASDDINYRRFFDINDLAALRMETEAVFEDTHRLVMRLVSERKIEALRIDHPDGLHDPRHYFQRLQRRAAQALKEGGHAVPDEAHAAYVAIEKILASHERLPEDWPVDGTTGYRFANVLSGLFVDAQAEAEMDRIYAAFAGGQHDYAELVRDSKRLIMETSLASELNVLATLLRRIAQTDRRYRDFTLNSLRRTLREIVADFPVYRTYITAADGAREEDVRHIDWAIGIARKRADAPDSVVYEFIRAVLTSTADLEVPAARRLAATFVGRFQQFTSPVTAKATEDTAFYIYNRFVCLNEVGGDPCSFGMSLNAFHAASADRARHWPHTMLASSTHDNKRSEDVRARLAVLSEFPGEWRRAVTRWSRINRHHKRLAGGLPAPSRNDEYLLYQTLIGAWPLPAPGEDPGGPLDPAALANFRGRIQAYMQKAVREAKVRTRWTNPDEEYEQGLAAFIDALLPGPATSRFLQDFLPLQRRVAKLGLFNGLAQALLKFTSPGVPDLYQGTELWDFSLVDPDNRRPVDYEHRANALATLQRRFSGSADQWRGELDALLQHIEDGRLKLYLIWRSLQLRARLPAVFEAGDYQPLSASGEFAANICAFARSHGEDTVIVVAPRLLGHLALESGAPLGPVWRDTQLPVPEAPVYFSVLTGRRVGPRMKDGAPTLDVADLFAELPVALLCRVPGD